MGVNGLSTTTSRPAIRHDFVYSKCESFRPRAIRPAFWLLLSPDTVPSPAIRDARECRRVPFPARPESRARETPVLPSQIQSGQLVPSFPSGLKLLKLLKAYSEFCTTLVPPHRLSPFFCCIFYCDAPFVLQILADRLVGAPAL